MERKNMNKEELDWTDTIYEWGIIIKGTLEEIEEIKKELGKIISKDMVKYQGISPSHLKLEEY